MTRALLSRHASLSVVLGAAACAPSFDDRTPLVSEPTILTVIAEPPEARPRAAIALRAVVVGSGPRSEDELPPDGFAWSFCEAPPPLGDPRSIADSCREGKNAVPIPESNRASLETTVPATACQRFGPEPPPGPLRPVDPDETGGFYQPIRIRAWSNTWVYRLRVRCNLPNVSTDTAKQFAESYVNNLTPELSALERLDSDGNGSNFESAAPSEHVRLRASWSEKSAEHYVWLPPGSSTVTPRREALRVRWLATAGSFAVDASGRAENDLETNADNVWTAPEEPGDVTLFLVLTDSRGASSVLTRNMRVTQ